MSSHTGSKLTIGGDVTQYNQVLHRTIKVMEYGSIFRAILFH